MTTGQDGYTIAQVVAGGFRDWLKSKREPTQKGAPVPADFFNPLKLALGGYIQVDSPDIADATFSVEIMSEFTRRLGGESLKFTDYSLHDPTKGEQGLWVTLRVFPETEQVRIVLLRPVMEVAFSKDLEKGLNRKQLTDNDTGLKYRALGSSEARVREISEGNDKRLSIEYWDFINEEQPDPRFYIVEMDLSDKQGLAQMYRGTALTTYDVKPIAGHMSDDK